MEMIMERNSKGEVNIGGARVTIPRDELALNMFNDNPVFDGGDYRKDGWIYVDDKPVRKWFRDCYSPDGNSSGVRIWEPVLSGIAALEARRWQVKERVDRFYNEVFSPAYDAIIEAGVAHAKPTHKFTGEKKWWRYYRTKYINGPPALSWDWVDTPDEPKNYEIGQRYYNIDRQQDRYYGYLGRFTIVLEAAIHKYLRKEHKPDMAGTTLRLVLNDRDYWYVSGYVGHSIEWLKVNWSGSPMIEIFMPKSFAICKGEKHGC